MWEDLSFNYSKELNVLCLFLFFFQAVRSAGISLCGVIYMYMGQNFRVMFDNEKPALLKELDAEIEKVRQ